MNPNSQLTLHCSEFKILCSGFTMQLYRLSKFRIKLLSKFQVIIMTYNTSFVHMFLVCFLNYVTGIVKMILISMHWFSHQIKQACNCKSIIQIDQYTVIICKVIVKRSASLLCVYLCLVCKI